MLAYELREYYGSWSKMAKVLDIGVTTYQNWIRKGYIPYNTQVLIELKSNNQFKADEHHAHPQ
jgi:hypothetical protein